MEIGEYVRTEKGIIGRLRRQYTFTNGEVEYPEPQEWVIDRFNNKNDYYVINEADTDFDAIVKHSKNIIDLIEVGDILKVHIFADKYDEDSEDIETTWRIEDEYERPEIKEFIKGNCGELLSILTHEMYEQNCYKLE